MSWRYLTLELTQMNRWTRKRRLKFRKRWRKQHGFNFRWFIAEYGHALYPYQQAMLDRIILFQRETSEPCPPGTNGEL